MCNFLGVRNSKNNFSKFSEYPKRASIYGVIRSNQQFSFICDNLIMA